MTLAEILHRLADFGSVTAAERERLHDAIDAALGSETEQPPA